VVCRLSAQSIGGTANRLKAQEASRRREKHNAQLNTQGRIVKTIV
jgi:hypothetical protein